MRLWLLLFCVFFIVINSMGLILDKIIDNEIPSGVIDGVNKVFILSNTPNPSLSLELFLNGICQVISIDYNLSNSTITFINAPLVNSVLMSSYRYLA